ncbi:Ankyrin repeat-containing domain protein [Beauveria brongniartii RCEF 3172]|uniref:Ankyrin repeat-containing domain protein n=1 Tax=Beauveria brongniartii RCEF 3172 TaxID=1081107 RepID=A0A162JYT5_9HYPO|nr:Ankyrin repeat-containing domain protein [Beauveria brongniartii RCEF 3172]
MPLIYGEGERAFTRLQEEIMKISDDQSIFAWESSDTRAGLLATSPAAFASSKSIVPLKRPDTPSSQLTVTSRGIYLDIQFIATSPRRVGLAVLHCVEDDGTRKQIGIYVKDLFWTMQSFERVLSQSLERIRPETLDSPGIEDRVAQRRVCVQTKRISTTRNLGANRQANGIHDYEDCSGLALSHTYSMIAALHNAVAEGEDGVVWLLLSRRSIDVNYVDALGRTPLRTAVELGHETIVMMLLQRDGIDIRDESQQNLLSVAVSAGHEGVAKLLLEQGVEIDVQDATGRTPLWVASQTGRRELALRLLNRGAAKDRRDKNQRTPLWAAADSGEGDTVNLLLEYRAAINYRDEFGQTALAAACSKGHADVVMLLLFYSADVNLVDIRHRTPLWTATANGDETVVRMLLQTGKAELNTISDAWAPLWLAVRDGHEGLVKLLVSHGANTQSIFPLDHEMGKSLLWKAVRCGHAESARLLLDTGKINPDTRSDKMTPLSLAASNNDRRLVELLLHHGADVRAKDSHGRTPISRAADAGYDELVKLMEESRPTAGDGRLRALFRAARDKG